MFSLSPLDNRYKEDTKTLRPFFSEFALMRYRVLVEIEYLIALSLEPGVNELPPFTTEEQTALRQTYKKFSVINATRIKEIETITKHDVKAVEYFLQEKLEVLDLAQAIPFLHLALTSEDINNIAYTLMWKRGLQRVYIPALELLYQELKIKARSYQDLPLLSLTHGQPASPTTIGKEFAVYVARLERQIDQLKSQQFLVKCSGATGTWAAHQVTYPQVDWIAWSERYISKFGLFQQKCSTQVNANDSLVESIQTVVRLNTILTDFTRDIWLYISRGVFTQAHQPGEVGSSTMPHKINPIQFENAEGNLGLTNAILQHLTTTLPVSRLQRDLSNSTLIRNLGVPMAHSLLAVKSLLKGLQRISPAETHVKEELQPHWELLAEPIQTILRKHGHTDAYEQLKQLTRGQTITQSTVQGFIAQLHIPEEEKERLLKLTPETYIGLASQMV